MAVVAIGVDVGGTAVKVGAVDPSTGALLCRSESELTGSPESKTPARVVSAIRACCADVMRQVQHICPGAKVATVGVGCPGVVRGGVVHAAANLPAWRHVALAEMLADVQELKGARAVVANDADAAAAAEAWVGAGRDDQPPRTLLMVTIGTGVGIGVVIDGRPLPGCAEGGHHVIHPVGGRPCACGQAGCLEAYCSGTAVASLAMEALERSDPHDDSRMSRLRTLGRAPTCADVFEAAAATDALAEHIVDTVTLDLARGLLNMCRILDPDVIVIAGGVSNAGEAIVTRVRAHLRRLWWSVDDSIPRLAIARVGDDSGIVGAAACATQTNVFITEQPPG